MHEEAFFAGAAVDGAFQEVRVLADSFTVDVGGENFLHLLPDHRVDERFMSTVVCGVLEPHFAFVIRVSEDLV